jgi:nucleotide-binding universal stress UspA family protein
MFKCLLVPIDGSEAWERAAEVSLGLAAKLGARVVGFVAEPQPPLPKMSSTASSYARECDDHGARVQAHAQEVLRRFGERAAAAGVVFEGKVQLNDSVEDAIAHAAVANGCDLIVMVTHGRDDFGALLFGSHSKNVMARTKLPLLVLH